VETFYDIFDTNFNLAKLSLGDSSEGIVDDLASTILASVPQIKGFLNLT
jgi:hypothetical protein